MSVRGQPEQTALVFVPPRFSTMRAYGFYVVTKQTSNLEEDQVDSATGHIDENGWPRDRSQPTDTHSVASTLRLFPWARNGTLAQCSAENGLVLQPRVARVTAWCACRVTAAHCDFPHRCFASASSDAVPGLSHGRLIHLPRTAQPNLILFSFTTFLRHSTFIKPNHHLPSTSDNPHRLYSKLQLPPSSPPLCAASSRTSTPSRSARLRPSASVRSTLIASP